MSNYEQPNSWQRSKHTRNNEQGGNYHPRGEWVQQPQQSYDRPADYRQQNFAESGPPPINNEQYPPFNAATVDTTQPPAPYSDDGYGHKGGGMRRQGDFGGGTDFRSQRRGGDSDHRSQYFDDRRRGGEGGGGGKAGGGRYDDQRRPQRDFGGNERRGGRSGGFGTDGSDHRRRYDDNRDHRGGFGGNNEDFRRYDDGGGRYGGIGRYDDGNRSSYERRRGDFGERDRGGNRRRGGGGYSYHSRRRESEDDANQVDQVPTLAETYGEEGGFGKQSVSVDEASSRAEKFGGESQNEFRSNQSEFRRGRSEDRKRDEKGESQQEGRDAQDNVTKQKVVILSSALMETTIKGENIVIDSILVRKQEKSKEITMFQHTSRSDPLSDAKMTLDDVSTLLDIKTEVDAEKLTALENKVLSSKLYLGFYLDQKFANKIVLDEIDQQLNDGDPNVAAVLAVGACQVPHFVRLTGEKGLLNQFVATMTASESGALAKNEAFAKYAEQLQAKKEYLKAAAFFFSASKPHNGIRCLIEAKCYRDAALFARLRLRPTDDLFTEAHDAWASKYMKDRCYEGAAKCFLSHSDFAAAAEAMVKRDTPAALKVAVKLALQGGQRDCAFNTGFRCINMAMVENNWAVALEVVDLVAELQPFRYVILMHEGFLCVASKLLSNSCIDGFQNDINIFSQISQKLEKVGFMHAMWHIFIENGLDHSDENLVNMVELIEKYEKRYKFVAMSSVKAILPMVCCTLTLGLLSILQNRTKAVNNFAQALESTGLFTDVNNLINDMINEYNVSHDGPCCDVDRGLTSLNGPASPAEESHSVEKEEKSTCGSVADEDRVYEGGIDKSFDDVSPCETGQNERSPVDMLSINESVLHIDASVVNADAKDEAAAQKIDVESDAQTLPTDVETVIENEELKAEHVECKKTDEIVESGAQQCEVEGEKDEGVIESKGQREKVVVVPSENSEKC